MLSITVNAEHSYDVHIGRGLLGELNEAVATATRVGVIYPIALRVSAESLQVELEGSGRRVVLIEVPEAEAEQICELVAATMKEAMEALFPEVPIEVEGGTCNHWGEKG